MIRRNTFQRSIVLEAVRSMQSHATADEIYENVKQTCPTIGRATVYRNLTQLCEAGLVRRQCIPGTPDHFDHRVEKHYHAKCVKCGKVVDVQLDYMADLADRIRDACGFKIEAHDIVFSGICPECGEAEA